MKNFFEQDAYNDIVNRINNLSANSARIWGKMSVDQMLAHCSKTLTVPNSDKDYKQSLIGKIMGGFVKKQAYNDTPMGRNLPTAKEFKITDPQVFENEKLSLLHSVEKLFAKGQNAVDNKMHIFFGRLTGEEWGKSTYKHIDHHLKQFGV